MRPNQDDIALKELMARAKSGDRRAFGKVFRLNYKEIYDYIARRIGDPHEAEDLTMLVFTKGLDKIGSYEERGAPAKAWLFRIAHNVVVDYFRARRTEVQLDEVNEHDPEGDVHAKISDLMDIEEVRNAIALLPQAQSEVLTLRFLEDRSIAETAEAIGKKETTVRALQFKGINTLRTRLTRAHTGGYQEADRDNRS